MKVAVRAAGRGDADALLGLIRAHAAYERTTASVARPALVRLLGRRRPPVRLALAESGGDVLGYAALTFDFALWRGERFAHLDCLFVREEARGRGVGKALLAWAADTARQDGVAHMEWQTPDWNRDAIRFYVREGALARPKVRFQFALVPQAATSASRSAS